MITLQEMAVLNSLYDLEVCVPECHFPGTGFFPKKSGKFPVPSIREHPLPSPNSVPAFGSGFFPSRLSPENEMGIPEIKLTTSLRQVL